MALRLTDGLQLGFTLLLTGCTVVGTLDEFQSGPQGDPSCVRPAAGDYAANGNGTMDLLVSFGTGAGGGGGGGGGGSGGGGSDNWDVHQDIDPQLTARITHTDDCCWEMLVALNADRNDTITYCRHPDGTVARTNNVQNQSWDLPLVGRQDNQTTITCESGDVVRPNMQPGDEWTHLCAGTTTANPNGNYFHNVEWTYVGTESLAIGGANVEAYRFDDLTHYQGTSDGEQTASHWYAVSDARWLKTDTVVGLNTPSPLGDVRYDEDSHWTATE